MPLRQIGPYKIVEPDNSFKDKYWPLITTHVLTKHGTTEITDALQVQETLKECFQLLCNEFKSLIGKLPNISFFVFVQALHEDSIQIWQKQLNGPKFPIDQEDFAGSRRIMKYILEQGCTIDMKGHPFLLKEIMEQIEGYSKHLDELIYVGTWAFALSEYIARSQICPHSISIQVISNELNLLVNVPFNSLFSFIFHDKDRHKGSVVASDCIFEFEKILDTDMSLKLPHICGFVGHQLKDKRYRFGVFKLEDLLLDLNQQFGYPKVTLAQFYSGLIVRRENVLPIEQSILKTQDERRYMYRPILQYKVEGIDFWICGAYKWSESLTQLTTNCFPFGQFPSEWKHLPALRSFIIRIMNTHDKLLEDPAIDIIKKKGLRFDRNITTVKKANNQNLSLITAKLGEIDLAFIDEKQRIIYVAECKHNRSRYEFYNWNRDIQNFKQKYEQQLTNKTEWVEGNSIAFLEHFEIIYTCKILDKEKYKVVPLFIINAPTLYMYDSKYLVATLHDLNLLLDGKHVTIEFEGTLKGKQIKFLPPYFQNAEKLFN